MTILAQRLTEAMAAGEMGVYQLSKKAGIAKSTIYGVLVRDSIPSAFTLACLADALGVTMDWLWGRK